MKKFNQPLRRLLARAQKRFVRARAGSVLILVVALLVLMALIGTAFMSMAQSDRATATTHTNNTEIDLLLDGVINLVQGAVVGDLFTAAPFRSHVTNPGGPLQYNNWSGVGRNDSILPAPASAGNSWLNDRVPEVVNHLAPATIRNGGNAPYWPFITGPLTGVQFTTPYWNPNAQPFLAGQVSKAINPVGPYFYTQRNSVQAGLPNRLAPGFISIGGQQYPAWVDAANPVGNVDFSILAADTDGDGVTDAGYFKIPVGSINGLTYYAAVRIIDNAAAINANTASWPSESTTLPGDFAPTSVNLQRMVHPQDNLINPVPGFTVESLLMNRLYHQIPTAPMDDSELIPPANARADFTFLPDGKTAPNGLDALWSQLGRRLDNPSMITMANGVNPAYYYHALPINESILMARNFILHDPNTSWTTSPSILDRDLPQSVYFGSAAAPYLPGGGASPEPVSTWFQENFTYYSTFTPDKLAPDQSNSNPPRTMNMRPLLVARNPVSNYAPNKFNYTTSNVSLVPTLGFGDEVQLGGRAYVYIGPPPMFIPFQPLWNGSSFLPYTGPASLDASYNTGLFWAAEPWANAPTKVSVNTGSFGQLYTAYWAAMADYTNRDNFYPYLMRSDGSFPPGPPAGTEFRQFWSPLRDPTEGMSGTPAAPVPGPVLTPPVIRVARPRGLDATMPPSEVAKLRAAIAAVNTLALRDPASMDLPSQKVLLSAFTYDPITTSQVPNLVEATVFGSKPQPYIVTVYAENDYVTVVAPGPNPQGYVGVELFNPFPFDIDLTGCNLGVIAGRNATASLGEPAYPNMKILPLTNGAVTFAGFKVNVPVNNPAPIIKAGGYLVLENLPPAGGPGLNPATDAVHRPPVVDAPVSPTLTYYYVPNLSTVMRDTANLATQPGGELVLLRPRLSTVLGTAVSFTPSVGPGYNETANLYDLAPVDSFDFTGLSVSTSPTTMAGIYYSRANTANWRFVYPGRWDASKPFGATPFRQEGTVLATWDASTGGTDAAPNITPFTLPPQPWAAPIPAATYANLFPPIQMNTTGMPGPFPVNPGGNQTPFGAFTRNGDILQVPYFGAYRLRVIAGYNNLDGTTLLPAGHTPDMILEMNPLTLDCQQADDYDSFSALGLNTNDDPVENIGRFTPIEGRDSGFVTDDFGTNATLWRNRWAMNILDYLTVQSPQDDQLPSAPPEVYLKYATTALPVPLMHSPSQAARPQSYGKVTTATQNSVTANISITGTPGNYLSQAIQFLTGPAAGSMAKITGLSPGGGANQWTFNVGQSIPAVPNAGDVFVVYGQPESTQYTALHGLVNVNSASWRVLAAVPMVPNTSTSAAQALLNAQIAFSIVFYRDVSDGSGTAHGPFKNLFELNQVPLIDFNGSALPQRFFRDAMGPARTTTFNDAQGDITPYPNLTGNPFTVGDFEGTFLMMNRVSNMLTTRSDSFTAYILLQGWQDAESDHPTLKVQRRAAFLIDRSGVSPSNTKPTLTNIPTGN